MSDRPIDINVSSSTAPTLQPDLELVAQHKARLAKVLDRGMVVDRLQVDLPPNLHGEWFPRDAVSMARAEMLGFQIDTEHAAKRKLNDAGDSGSHIADVVFMTCSIENKMAMDQIRREQYIKTHMPKGSKQREELDAEAQIKHLGLPSRVNSQMDEVDGGTIQTTLMNKG